MSRVPVAEGLRRIPAYRLLLRVAKRSVMSKVDCWLGTMLLSTHVAPPFEDTKIGAVVAVEPPGLGVNAEAAI